MLSEGERGKADWKFAASFDIKTKEHCVRDKLAIY